jgi:hypothetical protein
MSILLSQHILTLFAFVYFNTILSLHVFCSACRGQRAKVLRRRVWFLCYSCTCDITSGRACTSFYGRAKYIYDKHEGLKTRLYIRFEYLCKVIDLLKSTTLPCAIDKKERTLVPVSNYSLYVNRRCITTVELILNTLFIVSLWPSLLSIPRYPSFRRSSSYKKGNLVWPKDS